MLSRNKIHLTESKSVKFSQFYLYASKFCVTFDMRRVNDAPCPTEGNPEKNMYLIPPY